MRTLRSSSSGPEEKNNLTQGHATNPDNLHPQDPQSQSVRAGVKARKDESNRCTDAANQCGKAGEEKRPGDMGKGESRGGWICRAGRWGEFERPQV
ncbi:hypothetical protein NP233_g10244 [Leucocoprinus birnbaumii]|uniref:Uncharacterized protein n=1 Tax=Leucocoprinus birnbaumii TaxID=56174 RepID=A0AAD5VPM7_9AGAR|nr:hypothetical protein NP233_g10244 [Leucocoprinus birnbaumii]